MLQLTPQMRILVAIEAVDGRKGIDSLVHLCRETLAADPFTGCVFIFRSRSATSIRLLAYDLSCHPSNVQWVPVSRCSQALFASFCCTFIRLAIRVLLANQSRSVWDAIVGGDLSSLEVA